MVEREQIRREKRLAAYKLGRLKNQRLVLSQYLANPKHAWFSEQSVK